MAIAPAQQYCLHQDDDDDDEQLIMSLREDLLVGKDAAADDDRDMEESLKALRARVEAELQDQDVDDDILPPESWEWAEGVEAFARRVAEAMAGEADDIHRALSLLSSRRRRPGGEEQDAAFVAALRTQAVRVGARRADAEEVAAATRRLRENDLRRVAAAAGTDSSFVPMEEPAVPAQMEMDSLAVTLQNLLEECTASLAARLRRGVAEFADKPGEEAFVAAMQMEADRADAYLLSLRRGRAAVATAAAAAAA